MKRKSIIILTVMGSIALLMLLALVAWPTETISVITFILALIAYSVLKLIQVVLIILGVCVSAVLVWMSVILVYGIIVYITNYDKKILEWKYGYVLLKCTVYIEKWICHGIRVLYNMLTVRDEFYSNKTLMQEDELSQQPSEEITPDNGGTQDVLKGREKEILKIQATFWGNELYAKHVESVKGPPKFTEFQTDMHNAFKTLPYYHFQLIWKVIRKELPEDLLKGGAPAGPRASTISSK